MPPAAAFVPVSKIESIVCHRRKHGREEFLVKWKEQRRQTHDCLSWHSITELTGDFVNGALSALWLVQLYLQDLKSKSSDIPTNVFPISPAKKRKHEADNRHQVIDLTEEDDEMPVKSQARVKALSPLPLRKTSSPTPAPSIGSAGSSIEHVALEDLNTYNCRVDMVDGQFTCVPLYKDNVNTWDFPTQPMRARAREEKRLVKTNSLIRQRFIRNLQSFYKGQGLPPVEFVNIYDDDTPSLGFEWIYEYRYGAGVNPPDPDTMQGCGAPSLPGGRICQPDMGGHCGCEYTKDCTCLEYAPPVNPADTANALNGISTVGKPKRFPYSKETGFLVTHYINSRFPIYECNDKCHCLDPKGKLVCKSRVVQFGRTVGLEIFRTPPSEGRGWGLRALKDLQRGQYVWSYLGEIITEGEVVIRRDTAESSANKNSYLFHLDKHKDDLFLSGVSPDQLYTVDGEFMGNATRFINHSCEPNCGVYVVQFNKNDNLIYTLAFFALEFIPKGTELTFDYLDKEEGEDDGEAEGEVDEEAIPCRCGAERCRKFLW